MTTLTWNSIAAQLQMLGIELPVAEPAQSGAQEYVRPTFQPAPPFVTNHSRPAPPSEGPQSDFDEGAAEDNGTEAVAGILKAAQTAGVRFFERVTDGQLVAEGLRGLSPDLLASLRDRRDEIRGALLPQSRSTPSRDLLEKLGVELLIVDSESHAAQEVRRICQSVGVLGLDLETAPRPEFLRVQWPIAITKDGRRCKVQPQMDTSAALDPFRSEVRLLQVAAEIEGRIVALVIDLRRVPLTSPAPAPIWRCKLVGHDLSFDLKMLLANGIEIQNDQVLDTILMAGLVLRGTPDQRREGSRRPSLADAAKEVRGLDVPKVSQLSPWWRGRLTEEQVAYAALDAVISLRIANALHPRVQNLPPGPDGTPLLDRLCRAVLPVARMELSGVMLDHFALARQATAWDEELLLLRKEVAVLGIENPSSGPQVGAWLRHELTQLEEKTRARWISTWPRTPSGGLSTSAKHLRRLSALVPGVAPIIRYSAVSQLQSNFGDKLLGRVSSQTGRLHGNFLLAMAKIGRFSSSNPNLQNIPKSDEMRSVFTAAAGRCLVVADYSQLELRVMAEIAKDTVMTEAYRSGLDLHAVTAAGMLGIKPDQFDSDNPDHKVARQKAKAVNSGVIYGSGPRGLQEFARDAYGLQMTLDEARSVIDRFLATYPGVARWQRSQAEKTKRLQKVSTVGGRVYRFAWEPKREYSRNLALNLPVQGTAAEIAIEALIRVDARLSAELAGKAQLVLQVHDEFVVEVDDDELSVETAKRVLEEEMAEALKALLPDAPTTGLVDANAGKTWASAKG